MDSQTSPYRTYETPPLTGADGPVETVAVIGYGNQGKAQAQNIRDSGLPVTVGLRENSPNRKLARSQVFDVTDIATASSEASAIIMLVPDEFIHEVAEVVQDNAKPGSILLLAHGASLYYDRWKLHDEFDCGLIAPHGPGIEVRRLFTEGSGIPAMLAEVQCVSGNCVERIELLAATMGCARKGAGIRWTSLREEVETDLFVEQALLVGGVIELLRAVVSTMVRAGYDPAICRMSTLYELPIISTIYDRLGPSKALKAISPTAAFGAATRGPRLVDQHIRRLLEDILEEIRNGTFVRELVSPEAPLILDQYIAGLEASSLSEADRLFTKEDDEQSGILD